jgi:hypothetical protein
MYRFSWSNTARPVFFKLNNQPPFSSHLTTFTGEGITKIQPEKIEMSNKETYDVGKTPLITITECTGEAVIKGEATLDVRVQSGMADVTETEKGLSIDARSSLNLRVPSGASLDMGQVRGNMVVKGVEGDVGIDEVNGNLAVKNAGNFAIGTAYGNTSLTNIEGDLKGDNILGALAMKHVHAVALGTVQGDCAGNYITGDFQATKIMGDLSLHTVNGGVDIVSVMGDVSLRNIGGIIHIQNIDGDALIRGGLTAGKHFLKVTGDVVVRCNLNEPLKIIATVEGTVLNKLPLENITEEENNFIGSMGNGETVLSLEVGGDLLLKPNQDHESQSDFSFDFGGDFSEFANLGEKFNEHIEKFTVKLQKNLGPDFASKVARQAEKAVEKAVQRVEQAQEKAWRHAGKPHTPPKPPTPPAPQAPKATPEEQMKILSMLEKGAISVEEATTLLEALEG